MNKEITTDNNGIQVFESQEFGQVRMTEKDGKPLFCGSDVAAALGYNEPHKAVARHCKGGMKRPTPTSGGMQQLIFISEGDVYRLITHSKLPGAERFEKWVFDEVLPSIRKSGMYATPQTIDAMLADPDTMIAVLTELKNERIAHAKAEEAKIKAEKQRDILIHIQKTFTSTEIAKELGMKSAQRLNQKLADKGVQFKQNGTWVLYSKYAELGYTEIKQGVLDSGKIVYDRRWTNEGRDFILKLFGAENKRRESDEDAVMSA